MVYAALGKLKKNSVYTTLTADVTTGQTSIPVADTAVFHDEDGTLIVKGISINFDGAETGYAEEITITASSTTSGAGNLTGVTRGANADGTIGIGVAWPSGTKICVNFTTGIYKQIRDNLIAHESDKLAKATNVTAINDSGIADGEIAIFNLTNKDIRTSDKTLVTTIGSDDTTIPTSKAVNDAIVNGGQAWASWDPTLTWFTANPTILSTAAYWTRVGKVVFYSIAINCSDSKGTTGLSISLPTNAATSTEFVGSGFEIYGAGGATTSPIWPRVYSSTLLGFNGFYAGTNGCPLFLKISGFYAAAT